MDIYEFYRGILDSLGLSVAEDGALSFNFGGSDIGVSVGDRRVYAISPELLRSGDWEGKMAFHPLCENSLRGQSEIIKKIRSSIMIQTTVNIDTLISGLMRIAVDTTKHSSLRPSAAEYLTLLPDVDAKTLKSLSKIFDAVNIAGENRTFSVFLKKGGTYKNEAVSRLAVVNFPIADEFADDKSEVFGVPLRKKPNDKGYIEALFRYVFGDLDNLDLYSAGTNDMTAPYLHALLSAYVKIAKRINLVAKRFKKEFPEFEAVMVEFNGWEKELDNLAQYRGLVPVLNGNDGESVKGEKPLESEIAPLDIRRPNIGGVAEALTSASVSPFNTDITKPVVPLPGVQMIQSPPPPPPVSNQGRGISFDELTRRNPGVFHQPTGFGFNTQQPQRQPGLRGGYTQNQPQRPTFNQSVNNGYGGNSMFGGGL